VFFVTYRISYSYKIAVFAALAATLTEVLPLEDYDNIAIPIVVGFTVKFII
jgi:dolichol kinase